LRELGVVSLGDLKRLLRPAARMPAAMSGAAADPVAVPPAPSAGAGCAGELDDGGERHHATVVFAGLSGYAALNGTFDPEEVETIMARIRREAVQVVWRHGGRVNQFVGDEVMALFGIPVARRDDPRRALSAALELHRAEDGIAVE
jgi:class 3 adenylate cyclase